MLIFRKKSSTFFSRIAAHVGILLLLSVVFNQTVHGQTGVGGTKSLFMGAGARAFALGNAYVALSDDPSGIFFNPAGLDYAEKKSVSFFLSNLIEGSNYSFVGLVYPTLSIGSFGFAWARISTGDIQETTNTPQGVVRGSIFDYGQNLFAFSYAKQLRTNFSVGLNLKLQSISFGAQNLSDSGFGADLGVLYRPDFSASILRELSFGLNIQNMLTPNTRLVSESETLSPLNFKLGLAKPIRFGEERNAITLLFDFNKTERAPAFYNVGAEYAFQDNAMLRVGLNDGIMAFGAGAAYSSFHFDYMFGKMFDSPDNFSTQHRFSVTIDIGKGKSELRRMARERREREIRLQVDNELWFGRETEFNTNMDDGRKKYYTKDYLGAYVDFNRAMDAAQTLVDVAMRLRGENTDDIEANMRVETANASIQEAQTMLELANAKSDSSRSAEFRRIAAETEQSTIEKELRDFILQQRDKGNAFFKNGLFSRALNEWQLALDRITQNQGNHLPSWVDEIKLQLENDIKMAGSELEGNVKEAMRRADALARRGDYVQALNELNSIRASGISESERKELELRIKSLQAQLTYRQNFDEGVRSYENKDWKQAAGAFQRALSVNPNDSKTKKYYEDARARSIATVQEMPPNLRVKYARGYELFRQGNYKAALDIWEEILKDQPYNKRILDSIDSARERLKGQN
jgi:tetratricopeptide (TPR) repeat protein